jgi:hypothetical protein
MLGSWIAAVKVLAIIGVVAFVTSRPTYAQPASNEPGGDPSSASLAQTDPDQYAWMVFFFLNLQAAPGVAGVPASGKTITAYDEDTPTVWETWALASGNGAGQEGSEVYKPNGSDPGCWNQLSRSTLPPKVFSIGLKIAAAFRESNPAIGPGDPTGDFEVRMNRAAFEFVRQMELYNIEGLAAKFTSAKSTGNRELIQFPAAAKEVKAIWIPADNPQAISASEKARYHWRRSGDSYYKLAGFHVTTKDLKQWFWADFSHEDFETTPGPALLSRDSMWA